MRIKQESLKSDLFNLRGSRTLGGNVKKRHDIRAAKALLVLAAVFNMGLQTSAALKIETVFGPETKTGPYKHPTTITELSNGDFLLAYYGGGGEYEKETAVFSSRLKAGSSTWSKPVVLARNPVYSMGNPVLWQAPDSKVWLFYVVRPGATWSTSRIAAKISEDGGKSWSDSFMVTFEEGTMVRSRPVLLSDGHYLLPIYHETGADTEKTGADTSSLFLRFDPRAAQWTQSNKVFSRMGNLQAAVVEIQAGHLLALCRRGGDYEPGNDGFVVQTESKDGGKTWSPGIETRFPNPNSSVELIKLRGGNLLFIYNHSMHERTPLRAVVSRDAGKTWSSGIDIASGTGSFSYPTAIQTRDGVIHITFTSDERTKIRHAILEESDLR